jgi:hypothetical protein
LPARGWLGGSIRTADSPRQNFRERGYLVFFGPKAFSPPWTLSSTHTDSEAKQRIVNDQVLLILLAQSGDGPTMSPLLIARVSH